MTCLSIIQNAAASLALPIPAAIWSSTDAQIIQLRTLLNEEGSALSKWPDHTWNKLVKETNFVTVALNLQTGAIPADFNYILDQTLWNRTMNRPIWGPMDEQQWQQELAGPTFTSPYYAYRIRGGQMLLTPPPAVGNSIFYEYVSTYWAYAAAGTTPTKPGFSADDDFAVWPDILMTRGLRWRFLRANGLDYSQEYASWMEMLTVELARDGGSARLSTVEKYPWNRRVPFVPQGNWNI